MNNSIGFSAASALSGSAWRSAGDGYSRTALWSFGRIGIDGIDTGEGINARLNATKPDDPSGSASSNCWAGNAHPIRPKCLCSLSFRKPFRVSRPFRRGGDRLSVLANYVRRSNGWSGAATSRHTGHPRRGGAGGAGELGHPRPSDDHLAVATCLSVALSGTP